MKTKLMNWLALLLTAGFMLAVACKGDDGAVGPAGPKGEQGIAGAKGDKGDKGAKGDKGDKGAKGDKGDKGEEGNANVKHTGWLEFDNEADWIHLRPDFAFFRDNNIVFNFSEQTIKSIAAGDYITLCYVRKKAWAVQWPLPSVLANGDFVEFGNGRKMMNYLISANEDGSDFKFELNVTSTDGTNVKGGTEDWQYRLIFVAVSGIMTKSASADALKEELQKLSYEEVCARYDIEP